MKKLKQFVNDPKTGFILMLLLLIAVITILIVSESRLLCFLFFVAGGLLYRYIDKNINKKDSKR